LCLAATATGRRLSFREAEAGIPTRASIMDFLFTAVEIVFQTKHPTILKLKTGRENQLFCPFFKYSPTASFLGETPFSGHKKRLYPTYCGCKKIFRKSYTNDIPK
jgi:hypothetical protein